MKITIFSEELRECLDAAGLSDCGENDTWNYWYQRLMNAYNESVERQIMTEQAENAKLRELVDILCFCMQIHKRCDDCKLNGAKGELGHDPLLACDGLHEMLKELGIEVE